MIGGKGVAAFTLSKKTGSYSEGHQRGGVEC
jgi:hypothetical protein